MVRLVLGTGQRAGRPAVHRFIALHSHRLVPRLQVTCACRVRAHIRVAQAMNHHSTALPSLRVPSCAYCHASVCSLLPTHEETSSPDLLSDTSCLFTTHCHSHHRQLSVLVDRNIACTPNSGWYVPHERLRHHARYRKCGYVVHSLASCSSS